MKPDIHPQYQDIVVTCACGATYETKSTASEINVSICASCHPFYTGKQKFVDEAGRIEKFMKKYKIDNAAGEEEQAPAEAEA